MVRLALYDYGAGNIFSLKNAFEKRGAEVRVITSLKDDNYSGLLLPGVGNFDPAMKTVSEGGVREMAGESMPVLGICLGMEMFLVSSQEGTLPGMGIIPGKVVILPDDIKRPHMGWNGLNIRRPGVLLDGVPDGSWVYFVHSYMTQPRDPAAITADVDYGTVVPAVIEQDNYLGTQFHPEKSGDVGKIILDNFLEACRR